MVLNILDVANPLVPQLIRCDANFSSLFYSFCSLFVVFWMQRGMKRQWETMKR